MEVILSIIASVLELFNNVIEMIKALCGFSSVKEKQEVDLSKFQTFCIGYPSGPGCVAEYNQETSVLTMNFDFGKTKAEQCSVVIFPGKINVRSFYKNNGCLVATMSSDSLLPLDIEIQQLLKNVSNPVISRVHRQIERKERKYKLHLKDFVGAMDEMRNVTEIKFVVNRGRAMRGTLEISCLYLKQ